jgi:uridine kinase
MNNYSDNPHQKAAKIIVSEIIERIKNKKARFVITVAGESGCGKTETGKAILSELKNNEVNSVLLEQDDYFVLPPASNDAKRKSDPNWLGPHVEVKMEVLENNLKNAVSGASEIEKPSIDYYANSIENIKLSLTDVDVIIAEGTYTSLLRNIDARVFITSTFVDTLPYRKKRNRGNEVQDPFVENILSTEHKIIAGHRYLADFIISKDYDVKIVK